MHCITHLQDHSTRLLTAIRCNDCQAVEVLLKENTDTINGCSKVCAFYYIFLGLLITVITFIIQFGCTALHYASRQGYENIVKMLIDKNANVDIQRKVDSLYTFNKINVCINAMNEI